MVEADRLRRRSPRSRRRAWSGRRPTARRRSTLSLGGQTRRRPGRRSPGSNRGASVDFVHDVDAGAVAAGLQRRAPATARPRGKNGFKLSLRGYDPLFDLRALTDDLAGRRFNRAAPDDSLMLLKPTGARAARRRRADAAGRAVLRDAPRAGSPTGVKLDLDSAARRRRSRSSRRTRSIQLIGMKQQMRVLATYADGSVRDVTAEAFIESGNTEVATVDKTRPDHRRPPRRGAVLARYEGAYAATTLTVMGDRTGFVWEQPPANN